MEPTPPDPTFPRYTRAPFPRYRFVPGQTPHPRSDPRGHAYGRPEARVERIDPGDWARSELYLRGVDLYNFAYWWEAHEAFEALWRGSGGGSPRAGVEADFFQGLIQIAAALLKRFMGAPSASAALLGRGLGRLHGAPSPYLGLDVRRFERETTAYFAGERAQPALIALDFG
ncbi:MAG: DUF309 domain-containing protein [Byssovorax sp.]